MLDWLANRLIMFPTRHPLPTDDKTRLEIESDVGPFEVWRQRTGDSAAADLFVLKFVGTGGRAERASDHPAMYWDDLNLEIWAVNPPGYGGSPGRARLGNIPTIAAAAFAAIEEEASGRPIVVAASSLGTLAALYLASREKFAGLIVRNPPPLRDVITTRFGWWTLHSSRYIANRVPAELCTIDNARQANIPAVFISSRRDRVVPTPLQDQVYQAYRGPHRIVHLSLADHADALTDEENAEYARQLAWLREEIKRSST